MIPVGEIMRPVYGTNDKRDRKRKAVNKPVHFKKAPIIASIATAVVFVAGVCTMKDIKVDKEAENKKGNLVAEDKVEKPKTKTAEVFMSEIQVPEVDREKPFAVYEEDKIETKSVTKTVKEGDELPSMWLGTDFRHMQKAKVGKVDENGIEVVWSIETSLEKNGFLDHLMNVPYGETGRMGEFVLVWEIKPEKGKKAGEAVVTVKYPDLSE